MLSKNYFLATTWRAYDRLLFLHFLKGKRRQPTWLHPSVVKSAMYICLLADWPLTPGNQVVPHGSKVNWFGEACLWGSDWEAEDPVSVLCKVQSCVTYWHTHVCFEYHWVLRLLSVKKKKKENTHNKKKTSPCLVLCSQPELDEYSRGGNTSGMQHQLRCLASCIYWFFVAFSI